MWTRTLLATSVATALVFGASVNAATQKDDDSDSVHGWGPWNGVQTAAGPGAGAAAVVPLLVQFAQDQNNRNSNAFDADVQQQDGVVDNAGLRQYHAWYSKEKHAESESTEQAYFTQFAPRKRDDSIKYKIGTDAGDQKRNPRRAFYDADEGFFVSDVVDGPEGRTMTKPASSVEAPIYNKGDRLPSVGSIVQIPGELVEVPGSGAPVPNPAYDAYQQQIIGFEGVDPVILEILFGPPPPMMIEGEPVFEPGPPTLMYVVKERVDGKKVKVLKELPEGAVVVKQQHTQERNRQYIAVNSGDKEGTVFYGNVYGGDEERSRTRTGIKDANGKWLVKQGGWTPWETSSLNNTSNFIYGQSSTIDAVTEVLSGAGTATYRGGFLNDDRSNVILTLDFGTKSWGGTFNPSEAPSFEVAQGAGSFNGVDLVGAVSASESIVSGTVDASFFGDRAQHIGGIADVNLQEGGRFVDVFGTHRTDRVPVVPQPVVEQ